MVGVSTPQDAACGCRAVLSEGVTRCVWACGGWVNVPIRAVEDLRKSQGCSVQSGASWPVSSASPGSPAPGACRPPLPLHACAMMQHRRPGGQGSPEGRAEQSRQTSGQREAKPPGPWQIWDISRTEPLVALCDPRASPRQLHHKTRLCPGKGPTS